MQCSNLLSVATFVTFALFTLSAWADSQEPARVTTDVPAGVSQDWWSAVQADIAASEYRVTWQDSTPLADVPAAYHAANRTQNLRTYFTPDGFLAIPRNVRANEAPPWEWGLSLAAWGREGAMQDVTHRANGASLCAEGNRLEYDRGGLTEWYVNDARGLEQGFTIHKRQDVKSSNRQDQSLRIEMAVTGNVVTKVSSEGRSVDFLAPGGALAIRFANLHATDAAGRALATRFELSAIQNPQFLTIVVDDSGAVYPIIIDPLATSPSWTAESDQASANLGVSVATAGDVNGDGYSDVIVGANGFDNGQSAEGGAFVYHGSAAGISMTPNWTAEGDQGGAQFGFSVATAGDVNGDGFSDVIVGAFSYDNNGVVINVGRAFVYHGSASGLSAAPDWTANSNQSASNFGTFVATAGDVNGDGFSDVIVGAQNYDNGETNEGRAYVFHGSAAGLSATPNWTAESDQASANFGTSVALAGDVDGDGFSDVIVGAPGYANGQSGEGRAFVYHGSAGGLSATPNWTAESDQAGAILGRSVSTAGDVNGDGYSDVIVGAEIYSNGQTGEGAAFVWFGSAGGLGSAGTPGNADWSAESDQASASFGRSVATAGDVNGDGYGDVIVGAHFYDGGETDEGRAYVYHGSATGLSGLAAWTVESDQSSSQLGHSVATAGDVNGDGYSDVIVGANLYDNVETDEGRAFVYCGAPSGLATTSGWSTEQGTSFGFSVATAGDVDGDGYSDVIVGAPWYDNGEALEGRAYVYYGSDAGLFVGWTAEGNQENAEFGRSVASAGDVNGDGYSDVIIGAPFYDDGETDEGRAYIYYGSDGGLFAIPHWPPGSPHTDRFLSA